MEAAVSGARGPQIRVFSDYEALSLAAADLVSAVITAAAAAKGRVAVALSGGRTPRRCYTLLGETPRRERTDWKRVHLFWADERCVPADHSDSNYRLVAETLLCRVDLPEDHVHRIRGEADPELAAREYEEEIGRFFGPAAFPAFDLVLLGAGEDGHTASLFPGSTALREKKRLAVPAFREAPKQSRVTLTLPALNHAAHILFLASGRSKAGVVHEVVEDGNPKQYPAGLVQPVDGAVTWLIDREAAGLLDEQIVR
jgi:6-phosphogluconolactonase